ncbi:aminoglycoside phosphotransferase family protein [Sporichthya sp.]|uniref:aminoglycoside phosphotransferase family protein n=1 Tax=Sporichthya sp. TaxID=65475 RepID=UPI0018018254|nr:aminoglycoside phosphotransferase family protein [Sporichthya sp.]MBA3741845.1 aminoglycoside phosphotransferase family protein [Sporichthya sp.]
MGSAAGLPGNVFLKSSGTLKTRAVLALLDLAASEVEFMTKLRPELDIESPRCYFANYDRKSCRHALVLEDVVATKAAEFCQADQPLQRGEIEDVLTLLATCHGRFWNSHRFSGDLRWLKESKTPKSFVTDFDRFLLLGRTTVSGIAKYGDLVPPRVAAAKNDIMPALWRSLDFAASGPPTVLHGDCHLGNFYRTDTGRIGVLDWQICCVGSWTFDVSYLLAACLTIESRRTWERDLIAFYLDRLRVHGGEPPPFDKAFDAYRSGLMYPLAAWMFVLNRPPMQPDMQPRELSIELVRRISTAIDDLDVLNLLETGS